jgi:hypothetical protein
MEVIDYNAIYVSATDKSLTIDWNVTYNPPVKRNVSVECVLNCDLQSEDCSAAEACLPYPSTLPAGQFGGCAVANPTFLPKKIYGNDEFFTCKMYDPVYPQYTFYQKVVYSSLDFSFAVSGVSASVGDSFNLPIEITNRGLVSDTYHVTAVPLAGSAPYVSIDNGDVYTEVATKNETVVAYPKVTMLVATPIHLGITITSVRDPRLSEYREIQLNGAVASMPDISLAGIVQIIFLTTVLLLSKVFF